MPESLTVSREDPAGDVVTIKNAWVRETDSKAKVNAGYMTLLNVGSEEVTLVKVESESYEIIEVHEMAAVDGLMEMREVTDMIIPANGLIQFKPGWHAFDVEATPSTPDHRSEGRHDPDF